jgi:hypothetical protein
MRRPLKRILDVYIFAFIFLLASRPLSDADFWFHLKTGEYIFNTGLVPKQELFSFTAYGNPWIAHGWLAGALFYAIYSRVGLYPLMFIFALIPTLAFWILFRRSVGHPLVRWFGILLGACTVLPNLGVRPRMFSLLFASIFLALLTDYAQNARGRAIWWLVPLTPLWVNLHGGYIIGLALIGLTLVGIVLDGWSEGTKVSTLWPRLRTVGVVLLGSVATVALNPYGIRMYLLPLEVLRTPVFREAVVDFISPNFHQSEMVPFVLLALITISALALSPKKVKPSQLLFFLAIFYSSLQTQRNIMIFPLVAVPLFTEYFQSWLDSTSLGKVFTPSKAALVTEQRKVALSVLLLLPLVAFAIQLKRVVYVPPKQETSDVPIKAVEYMKQHQITGNTITVPNIWGGYLIWALPTNRVYIDGRNAYPLDFVEEYLKFTEGYQDWRAPFNKYGVRNAIVSKSSVMAHELSEASDWQKLYEDEMAVVFTKRLEEE